MDARPDDPMATDTAAAAPAAAAPPEPVPAGPAPTDALEARRLHFLSLPAVHSACPTSYTCHCGRVVPFNPRCVREPRFSYSAHPYYKHMKQCPGSLAEKREAFLKLRGVVEAEEGWYRCVCGMRVGLSLRIKGGKKGAAVEGDVDDGAGDGEEGSKNVFFAYRMQNYTRHAKACKEVLRLEREEKEREEAQGSALVNAGGAPSTTTITAAAVNGAMTSVTSVTTSTRKRKSISSSSSGIGTATKARRRPSSPPPPTPSLLTRISTSDLQLLPPLITFNTPTTLPAASRLNSTSTTTRARSGSMASSVRSGSGLGSPHSSMMMEDVVLGSHCGAREDN
ncbi:hypothetical protein HK101_006201, partial [Irineochytrium annulatum]